ncbi:MAG: ABC transporter ATP-binding protein/permease [Lachnospiraceae bacterium]|nr:ABC transporter ATP-binding protein/permease [Lachnospiraceae bacterium]
MKKLLRYLKNYKKESILGPLFKLVEVVFELTVPLVMASLIDDGIGKRDYSHIVTMFGVLVLLGVLGLTSAVTAQFFAAKAAAGFAKDVKHDLFAHIQTLSFAEIDKLGTDSLITRMTSDMNQVQTGVNMVLRLLLRSPFVVFGSMIMAFTIDVKAALIFVVTIPVLTAVIFGIMLWCIPRFRLVQEHLDAVLSKTRENLTGARVLRAFCKEENEIEEFNDINETLTSLQKHVGRVSVLMNPVTYIIINCAIAYLIWTGAIEVSKGILTQGMVIALYNYMSQILVELIKLANLIINMTKCIACGNRIQSAFEVKSSMVEGSSASNEVAHEYMVEMRDVSFKYSETSGEVLEHISFTAKPGQVIGIIGGTGSGKSSLVHLIPRYYDVTNGQVLVDGVDVKEYAYETLRSKVSVCLQKSVLFRGTIRENMQWGRKNVTDEEILEALTIAQAKDFVMEKKEGLDFVIAQDGKNLSGGQKQRLTIARALLQQCEVLILDDTSSALDYATDAALRKALREMEKKITLFVVSQRTSSIQHADCILVLDDGNLVGKGTHEELLKQCEIYREIHESQYKKEAQNAR